jgi:hypothetical protein
MLLAFRGLAHDPQRVLGAICQRALVSLKLYLNIGVWIRKARLELGITAFAYADGRGRPSFYDPQVSVRHDASLTHPGGNGIPVEIKRHHYRIAECECAPNRNLIFPSPIPAPVAVPSHSSGNIITCRRGT